MADSLRWEAIASMLASSSPPSSTSTTLLRCDGRIASRSVLSPGKSPNRYGLTLTVLSSDDLPDDPTEDEDEEAQLIESYTPKFAYGR